MNVLGMEGDTSKRKVRSKYRSFCNLCRRRIEAQEEVWSWMNNQFLVHLRCIDKEDAVSNYEFRKNIKKRSKKTKHLR